MVARGWDRVAAPDDAAGHMNVCMAVVVMFVTHQCAMWLGCRFSLPKASSHVLSSLWIVVCGAHACRKVPVSLLIGTPPFAGCSWALAFSGATLTLAAASALTTTSTTSTSTTTTTPPTAWSPLLLTCLCAAALAQGYGGRGRGRGRYNNGGGRGGFDNRGGFHGGSSFEGGRGRRDNFDRGENYNSRNYPGMAPPTENIGFGRSFDNDYHSPYAPVQDRY